ncbi:MAG: lectin like domain-containing protein, partial [Synergistales bacterium]|nr:lectin like domain-containing protein [Synergistales bacterium]
ASGLGSETEALKAVSFYAGQAGASYHIEVYIGTAGHNPRGGILAAEFDGKLAAAGYHTIRLPEEVTLKGGDLFAVVVRLTTPGYGSPIPLEYPEAGYSDKATARAGQSFISQHGDDWTDLTAAVDNANVCLKAFTGPASINLDMPAGAGGGGCSTGTFSAFLLLALPLGLILTRHGA